MFLQKVSSTQTKRLDFLHFTLVVHTTSWNSNFCIIAAVIAHMQEAADKVFVTFLIEKKQKTLIVN